MLTEARLSWKHIVLTWLLKDIIITDAITLNTSGCAEGFCFLLQMPYCILLLCYTDTWAKTTQPLPQSLLPSLINPTLMDFVSSCFTLAVKVHYTNKTFLVIWQNYLSSLVKSKAFNKEIKSQEVRKVGNCCRRVLYWMTPWKVAWSDDHFQMNEHPSLRVETVVLFSF